MPGFPPAGIRWGGSATRQAEPRPVGLQQMLRRLFAALTKSAGLGQLEPLRTQPLLRQPVLGSGGEAGEPCRRVGHSSTRTTDKHYRHPVRDAVGIEATEAMDALLS
jgi:hypothetical protein